MLVYVVKNTDKIQCVCSSRDLADRVVEEYNNSVQVFFEKPTVEECYFVENESDVIPIPVYEYYYIVEDGVKKSSYLNYVWSFRPEIKKYLAPLSVYFISSRLGERVLQVFCTNKEECEKEIDKKIEELLAGKLKPISEEEADKILNG